MRLSRPMALAATSALLVTVSACGGTAEEESTSAGSSATSSSIPASERDDGYDAEELVAAMKAAVQEQQSTHIAMEMSTTGQPKTTAEGDVSYEGDTTAMRLSMQVPQAVADDVEMRLVDGMLYLAMPPMTPEGKFVELDTKDADGPLGDLGGMAKGDPLSTLDGFESGLEDVEYVGEESVQGEDLDHYVLTVDAKKAAAAQGAGADELPPGARSLDYDLWLDSEDLIRRMEFSQGTGSIVITMSDWGEPVTVEAPPASAIMKMPGAAVS